MNVSPKGGESGSFFGIVDDKTFWYLDMTGSGIETISHLLEVSYLRDFKIQAIDPAAGSLAMAASRLCSMPSKARPVS